MISISSLLWAIAGATAGGTHSFTLRHSAESASPWTPLTGLLRLVLVGVVLVAAAISGFLLSAFAGWITGFSLTLLLLIQRIK